MSFGGFDNQQKNVTTTIVSLYNQIRIYFLFSQAKIENCTNSIKAQLIANAHKTHLLEPREKSKAH
jgi:hypothetical protein